MKLAFYTLNDALLADVRVEAMFETLRSDGVQLYRVQEAGDFQSGTTALLALGGDGTFLSASAMVYGAQIPLLGVNLGRLGFLSENKPEDVAQALLAGEYSIEKRTMLSLSCASRKAYALNEVCVSRAASAMLGIDVVVDGHSLPTYWADGLLVSTSSGSTAYSLSVGGPICAPQAKVLIIAPIAPHNLNVRPLVVSDSSRIEISLHSREAQVSLAADNVRTAIDSTEKISVCAAPQPLSIVCLQKTNFIEALHSKLFWGEDVRNSK